MEQVEQAPTAGFRFGWVWGALGLLALVAVAYAATRSPAAPAAPGQAEEPEGVAAEPVAEVSSEAGAYLPYSADQLARAGDGDVVLFFHAGWCPTCRAADAAILAKPVPPGLTVLKVDYDSSAELKRRYGVTTQHTFVQVDAAGNLVAKWTGLPDAAAIAARVL